MALRVGEEKGGEFLTLFGRRKKNKGEGEKNVNEIYLFVESLKKRNMT